MCRTLVSIIVSTYRRDALLKEALLSLLHQEYSPLEIIVVDDNGNADWNQRVRNIVHEIRSMLMEEQTLIHITNSSNLGSAQSRNAGIYAANGSYITFLDDDDVYLPQKISAQLSHMQQTDSDFSLMDLLLVKEGTDSIRLQSHPDLNTQPFSQDALLRYHLMHHLTGTDALMFKRDYLIRLGGFGDIDIGDEFYLMAKAIQSGGRFSYLPKAFIKALVHYNGTGLSCGPNKLQGENSLFAFKKRYFHLLSRKEKNHICARHHAVLAFAYFRSKCTIRFLLEIMLSFCSSPAAACKLFLQKCKKKNR